ncbi:hypothetical protein [Mucilaginibacter dorajii]|uniref:Uncharacterized protein n=1 Tax=Mucilaginibacter dorajii TaxID=692994 RepID=A0ABP7QPP7_9SPHI|nr:hypothetical protein [Mucilaginibacter dorajii]MCS3733834.1 putative Fe-S cluster-containing radical SAM superfamily protein [Mucilaginibacter dorajii]
MEQQIEATLTGTDNTIEGTLQPILNSKYSSTYEFMSIDETLHLVIAKDADGDWIRIAGTEPYLSSWVDELAEQII